MPIRPSSPSLVKILVGKTSFSDHSAAWGVISLAANSRTMSWRARVSSGRSKSMSQSLRGQQHLQVPGPVGGQVLEDTGSSRERKTAGDQGGGVQAPGAHQIDHARD